MRKRQNAEETARLLRDADRDLAKGLTVSDFCRKVGVAETTYYRWGRRNDPKEVDSERRCRELENEVDSARSRYRLPRAALGKTVPSNRFTAGCATSSWSGTSLSWLRTRGRKGRRFGGNTTESVPTAR